VINGIRGLVAHYVLHALEVHLEIRMDHTNTTTNTPAVGIRCDWMNIKYIYRIWIMQSLEYLMRYLLNEYPSHYFNVMAQTICTMGCLFEHTRLNFQLVELEA